MRDIKGMFDLTDDLVAFENGELTEHQIIELFQQLIDTGLAWELQGMYGRAAHDLIRAGRCHIAEKQHRNAAGVSTWRLLTANVCGRLV